jgi:hypothetical protein
MLWPRGNEFGSCGAAVNANHNLVVCLLFSMKKKEGKKGKWNVEQSLAASTKPTKSMPDQPAVWMIEPGIEEAIGEREDGFY